MHEPQLGRVQELALEAELWAVAVDGIADDGRADRRQVDADLVGAPGLERHAQQRAAGQRLDELEVGDGVAGVVARERHAGRVAAVAADRGLDAAAARARAAAHEREVRAADPAAAQLRLQARVRAAVAGHEQQAGGVAVEPVDDPGAGVVAARGDPGERVDERRAAVPRHGMHQQAGRLVGHHQVLVGVGERHAHIGRWRDRRPAAPARAASPPRRRPAGATWAGRPRRRARGRRRSAARRRRASRPPRGRRRTGRGACRPRPAAPRARSRPLELGGRVDVGRRVAGAGARRASGRAPAGPTPITMKLSARLNVGQWLMWMKSVTWPSRTRSARFETLPPTSRPSATGKEHVARAGAGEVDEHPHHRGGGQERHDPEPAGEDPERDAAVAHVRDRHEREHAVGLLERQALLDRALGHLIGDDRSDRDGRQPRPLQ